MSNILSFDEMEVLTRNHLMEVGRYLTSEVSKKDISEEDLSKDVDTIISVYAEENLDLLHEQSRKESFMFITELDGEDYVFYFDDDGNPTHELYVEPDSEEEWNETILAAMDESDSTGQPFDHIMGEILGGIR